MQTGMEYPPLNLSMLRPRFSEYECTLDSGNEPSFRSVRNDDHLSSSWLMMTYHAYLLVHGTERVCKGDFCFPLDDARYAARG
jgi:hypothetical protein